MEYYRGWMHFLTSFRAGRIKMCCVCGLLMMVPALWSTVTFAKYIGTSYAILIPPKPHAIGGESVAI